MSDWGIDTSGIESVASEIDETAADIENVDYIVGTNVPYGFWLEVGTEDMPPYPWFEPAIEDVMSGRADEIVDEADSIEDAIRDIAFAIEERAKYYTDDGPPGPDKVTGNLHNSIVARRLD